jgi:serine phosphatase RsbU (regulator of sigma subunit)
VQRALLLQERLDALVTLQSSLLPRLPQPDNLELAAHYRPAASADQVGGDWYDAVVMPSGSTSLMVGDVVGHNIEAAAIMGQLRNMLRAIAWAVDDAPSRNVIRLDQAMHDLAVDGMASLVYARIEQSEEERGRGERTLRWTNAGHPPPLLVTADGTARLLEEGKPDLMLGVDPATERADNRTTIPAESLLLLYTDGLVERRGEDITRGLDRLCAISAAHHALPVAQFVDTVLAELVPAQLTDDVAVLAVRFHSPTP